MDLQNSIGAALGTDYFGLREPFTAEQESYLVRRGSLSMPGHPGDQRLLGAGGVPVAADREDVPARHRRRRDRGLRLPADGSAVGRSGQHGDQPGVTAAWALSWRCRPGWR